VTLVWRGWWDVQSANPYLISWWLGRYALHSSQVLSFSEIITVNSQQSQSLWTYTEYSKSHSNHDLIQVAYQERRQQELQQCKFPKQPFAGYAKVNAAALRVVRTEKTSNTSSLEIKATTFVPNHTVSHTRTWPSSNQAHSHCAKTHHLALRSASTNPRQVPFSPILITVSQAVPSLSLVPLTCSFFLVSRIIFPEGV
jgi:hypothetical protein